ncbi:MAG: T9SS type A sorting domain-containing protein [Bacteroidota bacterium]
MNKQLHHAAVSDPSLVIRISGCLIGLFLLLCANSPLSAQGWMKIYSNYVEGHGIIQTSDGGFVIAGRSGGTASNAEDDAHLIKTDADGELIWANTYGSTVERDLAAGLVEATDGGFVSVGSSNGFAPSSQVFLFKTNAEGQELWSRHFGGAWSDRANHIIRTNDGGYLLSGCFDCTSFNSSSEIYLVKTDANGLAEWDRTYSVGAEAYAALEMPNGDFVVAAVSDNNIQDDLGEVILLRTNSQGTLSESFNYTANDTLFNARSILRADDGWIISGTNREIGAPYLSIYLLKTDFAGNLQWRKTYDTQIGSELVFSAVQTADGSIVLNGTKLGSNELAANTFLLKTDANGNLLWEQVFDSPLQETGKALVNTANGGFAIAGIRKNIVPPFNILDSKVLLIQTNADGAIRPHVIQGNIYEDNNNDCMANAGEQPLAHRIVSATNGNQTYYGSSNANGQYEILVEPGSYEIRIHTLSSYWNTCATNPTIINATPSIDTSIVDFPMQISTLCPDLQVDISTPQLLPCASNIYTVSYCNRGTANALNAYVELTIDANMQVLSASIPYTQNNGLYTFDLDTIPHPFCGQFEVQLALDCATISGQTHCVEAHIFPDAICLPSNPIWDGASIELEAACINEEAVITLKNNGMGNMGAAIDFIVIEDEIIAKTLPFLLSVGQVQQQIEIPEGKTIRIEAPQSPGHPGISFPSVSLEGCGRNSNNDFSRGFVTRFPEDDGNPFISIDCQESSLGINGAVRKTYPKGRSSEQLIKANTDIEYHIRIQNTSSDTLHRLVIRDTLSPFLNPRDLRLGTASHPYKMSLYDDRTVRFVFDSIALPPAAINDSLSQAYLKYRIGQQADNPPGTIIQNQTALYLDDAPMQLLPTLFHTIEYPAVHQSVAIDLCTGELFHGNAIIQDTLIYDTLALVGYDSISIYDLSLLSTTSRSIGASICLGEQYLVGDNSYTQSGQYIDTLQASNGCDSIVDLELEVLDSYAFIIDTSICEGDTYLFEGLSYTQANVYVHPYLATNGCDSIMILDLGVQMAADSAWQFRICEGDSLQIGDQLYTDEGTYFDTLSTTLGCDSIYYQTQLALIYPDTQTIDTSLLAGSIFNDALIAGDTVLIVDTLGEGGCALRVIYQIDLLVDIEDPEAKVALSIYPNPSTDQWWIDIMLKESEPLGLTLYNAQGQWVETIQTAKILQRGTHQYCINANALPAGVYWLFIQNDQQQTGRKLVLLKP